jgi:hypothetical protein
MKTATALRIPKIGGITILNIIVLVVLAVLVSHKVSQDHKSQVESAMRRLIKAAAERREIVKGQRVACGELSVSEVPAEHVASTVLTKSSRRRTETLPTSDLRKRPSQHGPRATVHPQNRPAVSFTP